MFDNNFKVLGQGNEEEFVNHMMMKHECEM